jgi:hypothetical protein
MKKHVFVVLVLALSLVVACAEEEKGDDLELGINLQVGQTFNQLFLTEQNITQTIEGQQYDMVQTMGMGYTFTVQDVEPDGNMWIQAVYDSTLFKQFGPGLDVEYDSSDPPDEIPSEAIGFAALVGQGFTMKMSPQGYVLEVQGVEEMVDHMLEELDLSLGYMTDSLEENFRQQFGAEAIKETMQNAMAVYPEEPVKMGDTWSQTAVMSTGFPMIVNSTWTLKERQKDTITIDVQSSVEPNPEAAPIDMVTILISYEISGEQQGTIKVDEKTGWAMQATLTQNLSGQLTMESPETGETMSWPVTIESTISIETLE